MRRTASWCLLAIGGLVLLGGVVVAPSLEAPPGAGVEIGKPAPDFTVEGLSGETHVLSHYRGRPVVIHFFASWLGWSCWRGMSHLNEWAEKYRDRGLVVIGIAVRDRPGKVEDMARFLRVTFPIGLDPKSQLTLREYRIRTIPTTVIVDRQGVVREIWPEPVDWPFLGSLIAEIL
jgi:peroxiredoxin